MSRRGAIVVGVVACVLLQACAKRHSPQDSTETGNPPVIDADRVALVVQGDEVHVVGEKGAVMPGGATIHVTNLVSDKRASGHAASNGSFNVKTPGGVNDGFSVQASNADGESKLVFVTPGGAAAPPGDGGTLSCEQQTGLASEQLRAALAAADDTCTQASDCKPVSTGTVCTDSCLSGLVSNAGLSEVEAAMSAVKHGVCADFKAQGCEVIEHGCTGNGRTVACMNGRCAYDAIAAGERDAGSDAGLSMCERLANMAMAEVQRATADADRNCSADDDCVAPVFASNCFRSCPYDVVSTTGQMQVQAAIDALNSGLCANFADTCDVAGPFGCPGVAVPKHTCRQGLCTADPSCEELENTAATQLLLAIAGANNSCSTNADCVAAPAPTDCNAGCYDVAVSVTGAATVQDAIDADLCSDAVAAGCGNMQCPAPSTPTCNRGRCEPLLLCQERFSAAQIRINQVVDAADRTCTKDADCGFAASDTDCGGGCGYSGILSANGRAAVAAAVAELNAGVCKNFEADGCMAPMPACAPRPTAVCMNGQCTSEPAP